MLLWLAQYLEQFYSGFHVFQYVTLRAILAILTALIIALAVGPAMIHYLQRYKIGQTVRQDGPQSHFSKAGTPTMGGLLIVSAMTVAILLWTDLRNPYILISLFALWSFAAIGWVDDYRKLIKKDTRGLPGKWKYFWQSVFAIIIMVWLYSLAQTPQQTQFIVPFFKEIVVTLGPLYLVLGYFVIVGTSNAVNLTDGLDGLAIMLIVLVGGALGIFAYATSHAAFANYLLIPFIGQTSEITVLCGALVGAGLGFLWFNTYPAQIFMGDMGSLSLGAILGVIAIMVRQEIVLFIMGGIFVAETLSVMLQVGYYKMTKKRIFRMAPLHHHYELKGWPEPRVVVRFWIITFLLVLLGLASLKVR